MEIIKEPKVEILDFIRPENSTTEIIDLQLFKVYAGYRRCYSAEDDILKFPGMEEISNDGYLKDLTHEKISEFIRRMRKSPHTSPLEHGTMTVHVSNVSRSAINQWVRHRISSHCVSGDTRIHTSSQHTNRKTIAELYHNYNKLGFQQIKFRCVDESTGLIGYNKAKEIIYTGRQPVYEVTTIHGYKIKATAEHRFFTEYGWKRLHELSIGDKVFVNGEPIYKDKEWLEEHYRNKNMSLSEVGKLADCTTHTIRKWAKIYGIQKTGNKMPEGFEPPNKGKTKENYEPMMRTSLTHLARNAKGPNSHLWKGLDAKYGYSRTSRLYDRKNVCEICGFVGETEVHHIDKNPINSDPSNLIELCLTCHRAVHHQELKEKIILSGITSIIYVGIEDTYDIEMYDPYHNFIAEGFVVHNSQKSLRYTDASNMKFCMPESVLKNEKLLLKWIDHLEATEKLYNESLSEEYNIPKEDARAILPLNVSTSIVTTMNFSAWIHFFNVRCCNRAQKEIRIIANAILDAAKSAYPCIFENVGPSCIGVNGKFKGCPEEHTCGNPPIKKK